jgi:hypothetical protein
MFSSSPLDQGKWMRFVRFEEKKSSRTFANAWSASTADVRPWIRAHHRHE